MAVVLCLLAATPAPAVPSAGNTNAPAGTPVEGAVSPVRPEAASGEEEAGRELNLNVPVGRTALHVTLPPAHRTERSAPASGRGPVAVAFHRDMPEEFRGDLSSRLEWTPLAGGSIAAAVSVTSPGAADMRMGVRVDLAPGGELRFFGADAGRRFPVVTRADLAWKGGRPRTLWSPVVEGDTIGIEITLPSRNALSTFSFSVDRISHGYDTEGALEIESGPEALECANHYDYQCGVGRDFSEGTGRSTAALRFETSDGGYVCSGTLLSDRHDTFIPYLLTANHCISTTRVAASVSARWFYQRTACGGGGIDSRYTTTSGGAELLATSEAQDSTLLRLRGRVPGGLHYAGWDPRPMTHPTSVFGIHHPNGGVKKWSSGLTTRYKNWTFCEDLDRGIGCTSGMNGIEVDWLRGTTEGGSSGSGLFYDGQYLIGALSAGSGSCRNTLDTYGNFSDFYPRIRRWLEAEAPPPPADDHGDTRAGATRVSIPSTTRGRLEQGGDLDYFRLEVSRAGELRVQSTGSTDTYGTLFGPGARIASDDDNGAGDNFRIAADVQPGAHYVEVRGYDGSTTGAYSLSVELSVSPPPPPPPTPLAYTLPLVTPASNRTQQGFVRIVNRSNRAGTVRIHAIDDTGRRFGPVSLALRARQTRHFTSTQLERGGAGLSRGVGDGTGNWRLELATSLDIEPLAYIRAPGGFVTSVHEVAAETEQGARRIYRVPFFHPGSNRSQVSSLRLINPGNGNASIVITGVDDQGRAAPRGAVRLTLRAGRARMLSAQPLEAGGGFSGRLGDGSGYWQLSVSANRAIQVMSLLRSPSGHLVNLSRGRAESPGGTVAPDGSGPGGPVAFGEQQPPERRAVLHVEGDRAQPGHCPVCRDDAALLPLVGRDDLHGRYASRHGCGGRPCRCRHQCRIDRPDGAVECRHVPLRCLRRVRGGRVRYRE